MRFKSELGRVYTEGTVRLLGEINRLSDANASLAASCSTQIEHVLSVVAAPSHVAFAWARLCWQEAASCVLHRCIRGLHAGARRREQRSSGGRSQGLVHRTSRGDRQEERRAVAAVRCSPPSHARTHARSHTVLRALRPSAAAAAMEGSWRGLAARD